MRTVVHIVRGTSLVPPSSVREGLAGFSGRLPAQLHSYTLLGAVEGVRIRPQPPQRTARACLHDAMNAAAQGADVPSGKTLKTPLYGYPVPQVVLHRANVPLSQGTVVVDLRPVGSQVQVFELTLGQTIDALCSSPGPLAAHFAAEGLNPSFLRVFLDGARRDFDVCLTDRVQSLLFRPREDPILHSTLDSLGDQLAESAAASPFAASGSDPRPPTPPVPPSEPSVPEAHASRWGSGSRWDHSVYTPLRPPPPAASTLPIRNARDDAGEANLRFTVFDVYNNRREFSRSEHHDILDLVHIAMEATPQLRRPWGHRIQRSRWPDYPDPQLVIWGALPPGAYVLPIRDVDSDQDVCTVEIPGSASPLEALILAERKCAWLLNARQAVARQSRLFLVDHARKDPFQPYELANAHIAEISSTLLHVGPSINPGRRWGGAVPQAIPTIQVAEVPAALLRRQLIVHTSGSAPVDVDGTGLDTARIREHVIASCGLRLGSLMRMPTYCPFGPGHPLHLFFTTSYDERLSRLDYWGLFDLRAVLAPPRVQFCVLPLPTVFDNLWLQERLCMHFPELDRQLVIYMNERRVLTHCSPDGSTPLFTVFDRRDIGSRRSQHPQPLTETSDLLHRCFGRTVAAADTGSHRLRSPPATLLPAALSASGPRPPTFPWQVPTHLDSHAMTSGPGIGLGNSFILIAPGCAPLAFTPNDALQPLALLQLAMSRLGLHVPCTLHVPTLCPSTPTESPFVVLLPAARHRNDRYVLVDASRVAHPPLSQYWVQQVSDTINPVSAVATLRRAQPSLRVMGLLFLDCRPIRSLVAVESNVPLLTILPESFAWDSLPSPLLGRLLASRRMALSATPGRHDGIGQPDQAAAPSSAASTQAATSTTTTQVFSFSTATTTVPPRNAAVADGANAQRICDKPLRFFVASTSGHVEALTLTGDLPIDEVMAQLCWQQQLSTTFVRGASYKACERVMSDIDLGFSVFISVFSPAVGEQAWLDFDPAYRYPTVIRLPFLMTTDSLFDICGRSLPTDTSVAISGTPWDGLPVYLQHSDVVVVRRRSWQLFSLPLFAFEPRVDGISSLMIHQVGPNELLPINTLTEDGHFVRWTPDFDFESLQVHWKLIRMGWPVSHTSEAHYQPCLLVALDIPPFAVHAGTRYAPRDFDVNLCYRTHLSHIFGNRRWRDSGLAYGDLSVMFDRHMDTHGRRPWLVAIAGTVDVILGSQDGSNLCDWPCPERWSLRPVHTVGPIGHAALQHADATSSPVFHIEPPGGPLVEVSSDSDAEMMPDVSSDAPASSSTIVSPTVEPGIWDIPAPDAWINLDALLQRILDSEDLAEPVTSGCEPFTDPGPACPCPFWAGTPAITLCKPSDAPCYRFDRHRSLLFAHLGCCHLR